MEQKTLELIEWAESVGFELSYKHGFAVLTRPATQNPEARAAEGAGIRQLDGRVRQVQEFALGRAAAAEAEEFLECQVFLPEIDTWGTLKGYAGGTGLRVSYRGEADADRDVATTVDARSVLIIADQDHAEPNSSAAFPVSVNEITRQLIEKTERAGTSFHFLSGLLVAKVARAERAKRLSEIRDLFVVRKGPDPSQRNAEYFLERTSEIRSVMLARARSSATEFEGQRAFVQGLELNGVRDSDVMGTIERCEQGGRLVVLYRRDGQPRRLSVPPEDSIIVAEEKTASSTAAEQQPQSASRDRGFGRLGRAFAWSVRKQNLAFA